VRVTWGPAARAARYVVRVRLHDGTSRLYTVRAKKRSLRIAGVATRTFGSVTVAGLTRSGVAGPAGKATCQEEGCAAQAAAVRALRRRARVAVRA
jgi:hypothetical protein